MNLEKITEYLDTLPERGIPSVDCIITKGHERVYRHMAGYTDADKSVPINGNELYLMFSMTKIVTMTALMQLVEKGLVSLEDAVCKYLPAYENIWVKDVPFSGVQSNQTQESINGTESNGSDENPIRKGIHRIKVPLKIKHLVSMQSGLDYDLNRAGIGRVLDEIGSSATTRQIVDSFVETPFNFEPGTRYDYSLSHDVVAAVIEVVSGKKFGDYLKENIFVPLGMCRTRFASPKNDGVEGLIQQFIQNEDGSIVTMSQDCCYQLSENYESGGAGLISCIEDYSLLGETIANGGVDKDGVRILNPETIEIIQKDLLCEESHKDIENKMGRFGYGYGVGMQVLINPEKIGSPAPKGVFGWDGAAGSMLLMDTVNQISCTFTMHVRSCGMAYGEVHPKLRDLIYS